MDELIRDDYFIKIINNPTVIRLFTIACLFVVIWLIISRLKKLSNRKIGEATQKYKYRKLLNFFGFILAVIVVTSVYHEKLKAIGVFFGVAGAGIAFALQEVIVSFAGWFAINFNNFFKVGDRVLLGGIKGDVIDIGMLRTTVMEIGGWIDGDLYNGRTVRVSNSFVFKEPVFNYSSEFPFLWDEIKIPIKLNSNLMDAKKIIAKAAEQVVGNYAPIAEKKWNQLENQFMVEDAQTSPMITMVADENWVTLTLRYVVEYKSRRGTKDRLFGIILEDILASSDIYWASAAQEITLMKE